MSVYQGSCDWTARNAWRDRPGAWRPFELAAMIVGFALFWPVGLAILFAKIGQRREGYPGDLFAYSREKFRGAMPGSWSLAAPGWNSGWTGGFGGGLKFGGIGNSAFDEWRSGELERLEAERRKLADAEREFAEHLANLRKARDREEFDRFMAERSARQSGATGV